MKKLLMVIEFVNYDYLELKEDGESVFFKRQ